MRLRTRVCGLGKVGGGERGDHQARPFLVLAHSVSARKGIYAGR